MVGSDAALRRILHGLPGVEQVGAQERAASLATRSIKREAKLSALESAVRMVDLTTLEGADTPGKVRRVCAKAYARTPMTPPCPGRGRVRLPGLVPWRAARWRAAGSRSPRWRPRPVRAPRSGEARRRGRGGERGRRRGGHRHQPGPFLAGRYAQGSRGAARCASVGTAHLKVILETGELATLDNTARAAGWPCRRRRLHQDLDRQDPARATPPVALVMLSAVRDFADATGRRVGVKVAGGIRTAKDAIRYLVLVREIAGPEWLAPDLFRIGASSLLNDLLMQRRTQRTGAYAGPDYFTLD